MNRTDPPRRPRLLIIGGGIAGIAAAIRARSLGPSAKVTIIESSAALGGKIAGEIVDGCVVDGAADVCIGARLRSTQLFAQLGLAARAIRANPDGLPTCEWRDSSLQRLPTSFDGELLTFPGGIQDIVTAACDAMDDIGVLLHTRAHALRREDDLWRVDCSNGTSAEADAVIIAAPAMVAACLLAAFAPEHAPRLMELEYPSTTTVTMAWRSSDVPRPLDATGYLVADASAPVSACTWTSAKNPTHAPSGVTLLRCFIRGAHPDPAPLMLREVARVLGISAVPLFTRVYGWDAGIPAYSADHADTVRSLTEELRRHDDAAGGIQLAGSAFHGVGIPDCILSGERAATAALSHIAARRAEEAA